MSVRVFGPTLGAGVRIEEQQALPSIQQAPFGTTGYAGVLEKGEIGKLIETVSKEDMIRLTGDFVEGSDLPDAARHFYELSSGAGQLFLVRVVDGTEVVSSLTLFSRQAPERSAVVRLDAKNAGRWGGKRQFLVFDITGTGDLTDTTVDTGLTGLLEDELVGGTLFSTELPGVSFEITGNTVGPPGIISLEADDTLKAQYDASGGGDLEFAVELENIDAPDRHLAVRVKNGTISPTTEWGLEIIENGAKVKDYPDLSSDPTAARYFVNVINKDTGNHWITAVDLHVGGITAAIRPANHFGQIAAVTTTVLTIEAAASIVINSITGADGTVGTFTPGTDARSEELILTFTAGVPPTFTVDSDKQDAVLSGGTVGTPYPADNKYTTGFDVTDGATTFGTGDTMTIVFEYLRPDEAIDGVVFPDVVNAPDTFFRIVDNTIDTVIVAAGNDLTVDGAPGDNYRIEYRQQLEGGYDGTAGLVDADFIATWDPDFSLFLQMRERNLGLIKHGTPGKTATAIQKAGVAFAQGKNGQYRIEVPSNIVTEVAARAFVQDTVGRNDYEAVHFPSFGDVSNTGGRAGTKEVSLTGMLHGREARTAGDFRGFHKAAGGIDHILSPILDLPTGDVVLNEELLNPNGINVVKRKFGNFIMWGDRIPFLNPAFRFKHQREQLSHYERVLSENFDFIVFAINDALLRPVVLAALNSFFLPEFIKRALRGETFEEAAKIKVDAENNPPDILAAGEAVADINLQLAETVEKFRIRISKAGIFEESGA